MCMMSEVSELEMRVIEWLRQMVYDKYSIHCNWINFYDLMNTSTRL